MAGNARYYTEANLKAYQQKFDTAVIKPQFQKIAENFLQKMMANAPVYMQIQGATGVPWYFIALIHMRESGMNFNRHLHNGDPLTSRTTHVPAKRPVAPPANGKSYTFFESAVDALRLRGLDKWKDWSIPAMMHLLEVYNGTGYIARNKPNPYLFSGTQHYTSGKYVADGVYSAATIDKQLGAVPLLKLFLQRYNTDGKKKANSENNSGNSGGLFSGLRFFLTGKN